MRVFPKLGLQVTAVFLSVLLFSTSVLAQAEGWGGVTPSSATSTITTPADTYTAAADAKNDAQADNNGAIWFLAGCLGSWVGLVLAYVLEPSPPAVRLMGKSPQYVAIYTDAYRKEVKNERTKMAWTGCGIAALAYIVYVAVVVSVAVSAANSD